MVKGSVYRRVCLLNFDRISEAATELRWLAHWSRMLISLLIDRSGSTTTKHHIDNASARICIYK